jgi:hypothetical protein
MFQALVRQELAFLEELVVVAQERTKMILLVLLVLVLQTVVQVALVVIEVAGVRAVQVARVTLLEPVLAAAQSEQTVQVVYYFLLLEEI